MTLGLHPDRYVAFPSARAIVLDIAADRYWRLSSVLSVSLAELLREPTAPRLPALGPLLEQAILIDSAISRPLALAAAASPQQCTRTGTPKPTSANFAISALAIFTTRYQLRRSGLKQCLAAASRRAQHAQCDDAAAAREIASSFERHRAWFPLTPRCLPDGLALHAVLCRCGIAARLIIGVRDQPFAAHCWVAVGDAVLNDPLEAVAELTPIFAL